MDRSNLSEKPKTQSKNETKVENNNIFKVDESNQNFDTIEPIEHKDEFDDFEPDEDMERVLSNDVIIKDGELSLIKLADLLFDKEITIREMIQKYIYDDYVMGKAEELIKFADFI